MTRKVTVADRREKIVHLPVLAGSNDLHAPVGKVPDLAGDLEPPGQRMHRGTESHALNLAAVEGLDGFHSPEAVFKDGSGPFP